MLLIGHNLWAGKQTYKQKLFGFALLFCGQVVLLLHSLLPPLLDTVYYFDEAVTVAVELGSIFVSVDGTDLWGHLDNGKY